MGNKRDWVLKAFKGEQVDKVPVGFWYHFTEESEFGEGPNNHAVIEKNLRGHQNFIKTIQPDFIKIMSDGFFTYPNRLINSNITSIDELKNIQSIGENHPWFQQQVDLIRKIQESFVEDIVAIYNIFAPLTYLKWQVAGQVSKGDDKVADFLLEDATLLKHVLSVIAEDIAILVRKVVTETAIDGIYFSVQTIQDDRISSKEYQDIITPSDLKIIEAATLAKGVTLLHICGYEGATNDLSIFKDYPAQIFNWAVIAEGVSLSEGRHLFGDKPVLGGFVNTKDGILYKGTKQEVQREVKNILEEAGTQSTIIGAYCTIPNDIDKNRISWVKEAVVK